MNILDVQDLNLMALGNNSKLLRNISFSLKEGEKLGIVGESGSGKTLLIRSLIQLLPSSVKIASGSITYQGQCLSEMTERQLQEIRGKEIGMVFQDPLTFLNPTSKIGVQIMEGYRMHFPRASKEEARARAIELLEEVGILQPELRFLQYPHQLSGGLRQRVLIAIALAGEPRLLIADEPTTALDAVTQSQIMSLLSKLQVNKTTILITHDLSLVASFCDRMIVMYAGQIVEDAPTAQLFESPQHPYTQQLLKTIPNFTNAKLATIPGSPPDLSKPILGCPFAPRCPHAEERCRREEPPLIKKSRCWLNK